LDLLEVARIIKPHGLGGEVGVLMHWDDSDALTRAKHVWLTLIDGTSIEREIVRVRQSGRGFLVQFAGVGDRDAAEELRGARLSVERSVLPEASPGEVYLADLVGRDVVGPDAALIGKVVEIVSYPSVDALVIERADGSRVEQPLVDDWVQALHVCSDRVILLSLDGLVG
jgi:16S rRNA processing protein RimM